MRQRNLYGMAGKAHYRASRPVSGPRRPVTKRGRMALDNSRQRHIPRADS